jgi:hypothetical protein
MFQKEELQTGTVPVFPKFGSVPKQGGNPPENGNHLLILEEKVKWYGEVGTCREPTRHPQGITIPMNGMMDRNDPDIIDLGKGALALAGRNRDLELSGKIPEIGMAL